MSETLVRPTRRTIVRGAVWTVPVISIAASAPAFAASTDAGINGGTPAKWGTGQSKHVSWDLSLTNGSVEIDSLEITFTYAPSGGGLFTTFTIFGFAPSDTTWTFPPVPPTGMSSVVATHTANIAPNATVQIHTDFAGEDNSSGTVSASALITYVGSPMTSTKTYGPVGWSPGSAHVH